MSTRPFARGSDINPHALAVLPVGPVRGRSGDEISERNPPTQSFAKTSTIGNILSIIMYIMAEHPVFVHPRAILGYHI
jgi:hypothetical protein